MIIGANTKSRVVTSADVGNTLRVRVRASNAEGSSTATSAATAVIKAKAKPSLDVNLDASRSTVVYGQAVTLSGSVSSGQAGESVTIMEHRFPFGRTSAINQLATVTTTAGGSFSLSVQPRIHTLYTARVGEMRSESVSVSVRPRLKLARLAAPHRFLLTVAAVRSFVGKYGLLQRWSRRSHVWVSMRRVYLRTRVFTTSPTVISRAKFTLGRSGVRIRVFMPLSQAVPGYISGSSNRLFI